MGHDGGMVEGGMMEGGMMGMMGGWMLLDPGRDRRPGGRGSCGHLVGQAPFAGAAGHDPHCAGRAQRGG